RPLQNAIQREGPSMIVLGLSGGFDSTSRLDYDFSYDFLHDAAAVLLEDGRMVAAVEQERVNRIKHTNRSAVPAARVCLETRGIDVRDVDAFAFYGTEGACNQVLNAYHTRKNVGRTRVDIRTRLTHLLGEEFGQTIDPQRMHFNDHHMCHALGAYVHSGFDNCLVMTIDGAGEGNSGLVLRAHNGSFEKLCSIPEHHSLGYLYREVIRFLGYDMFEEYKVMGLAPYGDPAPHREFFKTLYDLEPDGNFQVHLWRVPLLHGILAPRQDDEPFSTLHKNLAASLQEALEVIVFHVLRHFREATGETSLCLSGGVAHNSTLNGKILRSGLFDRLFIHPAADDSGGALGAALEAHRELSGSYPRDTLEHVFVGRDLGDSDAIRKRLDAWGPLITAAYHDDVCVPAAGLMADGAVIGWVQGRSEFGPRALGNRSILADPRPRDNMVRINKMIKKREGFRPFAPSVLEERANDYFDMPAGTTELPYMSCVIPVRAEKRALLGAVTHVDGSARIQTVTRAQNDRFYRLIAEFGALTGVPMLLNTSFNNNAEPIVDKLDEAVACYLTTGLDYLVAGDAVVSRAGDTRDGMLRMAVSLPATVGLRQVDECRTGSERIRVNEIYVRTDKGRRRELSADARAVLLQSKRCRPLSDAFALAGVGTERQPALLDELFELWAQRLVIVHPIETA
ncbi:MAG TPA: carbamoyltransferase C-terminal domain-containing protein, partial [Vicinamibacterales bacterium]